LCATLQYVDYYVQASVLYKETACTGDMLVSGLIH